jgi:hypothetical protein
MKQKKDIWLLLAREKFTQLADNELIDLCKIASIDWFDGRDTDLSQLFDQYLMMKNLYGAKGVLDVQTDSE